MKFSFIKKSIKTGRFCFMNDLDSVSISKLQEKIRKLQKEKYKKLLSNPRITDAKLLFYLKEIVYYEVEGLGTEFNKLLSQYRGTDLFEKIKVTKEYLNSKIESFILKSSLKDAGSLNFIFTYRNGMSDHFGDQNLITALLSYVLRYEKKIENENLEKEYRNLFCLSVRCAVQCLLQSTDKMKPIYRMFLHQNLNDSKGTIHLLERAYMPHYAKILDGLKSLCRKKSEYPYYMSLSSHTRNTIESYIYFMLPETLFEFDSV